MTNLTKQLENGWVIVVENHNPANTPIGRDSGKNYSNVSIWGYHPDISDYFNIKDSGLTPFHKKGYRAKEGELPTEFLWMGVEVLENRLNQLPINEYYRLLRESKTTYSL